MQRSVFNWNALALLALAATACTNDGVGDPCIPETIPCKEDGKSCGFEQTESYIETSSVQCRSRLCIVHQLDNGTQGQIPADPTNICGANGAPLTKGCVTEQELDSSVYCTCRCNGPKTSVAFCSCPSGFKCTEILTKGGDGVKGSYCTRPQPTAAAAQ